MAPIPFVALPLERVVNKQINYVLKLVKPVALTENDMPRLLARSAFISTSLNSIQYCILTLSVDQPKRVVVLCQSMCQFHRCLPRSKYRASLLCTFEGIFPF